MMYPWALCLAWLTSSLLVAADLSFPDAHWQTINASEVGLDAGKLEEGLSALRQKYSVDEPVSVFVTRHGLAAWHGGNLQPSNKSQIYSVGKTVTALLVGRALEKGLLNDTNATLPFSNSPSEALAQLPIRNHGWFSQGAEGGALRTWQQVLTMTSDFGLSEPQPGRSVAYSCNAVEFCAATLQQSVFNASTMEDMIATELLSAVQAQDDLVLPHHAQISGFAGGMSLSSRDLARLGVLVLADGRWKETQLVPSGFVKEAKKVQVPSTAVPSTSCGMTECSVPQPSRGHERAWNIMELTKSLPYDASGHAGEMGGDIGFGYMLWVMAYPGAVHMSGSYGQYVVIDSVNDLVIAVVQSGKSEVHPSASDYLRMVQAALVTASPSVLSV